MLVGGWLDELTSILDVHPDEMRKLMKKIIISLISITTLFSLSLYGANAKVTNKEAARSLECEDAALGIAVKEHSADFGKSGNPRDVKFGYDIRNKGSQNSNSKWYVTFPDENLTYSFYVYDSGCHLVSGTVSRNK